MTVDGVNASRSLFKAMVARVKPQWAPCFSNRFGLGLAITSCSQPVFSGASDWEQCGAEGVPPLLALEVDPASVGHQLATTIDAHELEVLRMPGFFTHFELISVGYFDGGHYVCDVNLSSGTNNAEWVRFDGLTEKGKGVHLAAAPNGTPFTYGGRVGYCVASAVYGRVRLETVAQRHGQELPTASLPTQRQTFRWSAALVAELPATPHPPTGRDATAREDAAIIAQRSYVDVNGIQHTVDGAVLCCDWFVPSTAAVVRAAQYGETAVCTGGATGSAVLHTLARRGERAALLCVAREGEAWPLEVTDAFPLLCKQRDASTHGALGKVGVLRAHTVLWRDAPGGALDAPVDVSVVAARMPVWGDVRTAAWHASLRCTLRAALEAATDEGVMTLIVCSLASTQDKHSIDVFLDILQSREFAGVFARIVICEHRDWAAYTREAVRGWLCNAPADEDSALAAVVEGCLRLEFGWTDVATGRAVRPAELHDVLVATGHLSAHELGLASGWLHVNGRWDGSTSSNVMVRTAVPTAREQEAARFNMRLVRSSASNLSLPPVSLRDHRQTAQATPLQLEMLVDAGGLTNVGCQLHAGDATLRIGTMIAANSGKPGGGYSAVVRDARGNAIGVVRELHARHTTQEEDVVSDWLLTNAQNARVTGAADTAAHCNSVYRASIYEKWGMTDPEGTSHLTIQGVDYTTTRNPLLYADAWVVDDVRLSSKDVAGPRAEFAFSSQCQTTLFFVAGPNASARPNNPMSSTRRTYSTAAANDYNWFRAGIEAAVRAGLLAMAARGCDVALVVGVSTGIYAGQQHKTRIIAEFEVLVNNLLNEPMLGGERAGRPARLGDCFTRVIWTKLA